MRVILHPEADEEFAGAVRFYQDLDAELGLRFYKEMERLIGQICAQPNLFRMFEPPARRHFSLDFPYAVIYVERPDCVWIVAVMHMTRRPGYWRKRLE